ncbi:MAG: thiol:disulfide interchange protein DsbA/DsbL [Gallionellaceae bacterium]|nr:thiol:disulfide interchange protein DsbA/DsbL [Gallionellaceae bacterium]
MNKYILMFLALLCTTQAVAFPQAGKAVPEAGNGYSLLTPAQPTHSGKKIEVLEFFFYGCSHCFKLHPLLKAWEKKMPKDVMLTKVPATFDPAWEPMTYTFYALQKLGKQQQMEDALYNVWNASNIQQMDETLTTDFVAQHGVDRAAFNAAYNAPDIKAQVANSKKMMQDYNIRGTPSLIVDGKYLISGLQSEDTIRILNAVIAKARKERAAKKR